MTLNVAHFCSGGGTTMESVAKQANAGELGDIRSHLVVASKPWIKALTRGDNIDIPGVVLEDPRSWYEVIRILEMFNVQVVSLNGWMPMIPKEVIKQCKAKGIIMLNQHPGGVRKNGLDFGGAGKLGMFGSRVTAARVLYLLATGAKGDDVFTESTVQFVSPDVDRGHPVGVLRLNFSDKLDELREKTGINGEDDFFWLDYATHEDDLTQTIMKTVEDVQGLLLPIEHQNVANVLGRIGNGERELKEVDGYDDILVPEESTELLKKSKERAVWLYPKG